MSAKEFSTCNALLAAFLIYRKRRFLRIELNERGKPQFVFEADVEITVNEKAFRDDCVAPVRTLARILAPLRREADALRCKFRLQQRKEFLPLNGENSKGEANGTFKAAARSSHQTPAVV
jgi:hypothetical protein